MFRRNSFICCAVFVCCAQANGIAAVPASKRTSRESAVLKFAVADAAREVALLRKLFPRATITADTHANALIVISGAEDLASIRTIASGLDARAGNAATVEPIRLQNQRAHDVAQRLRLLFPADAFSEAGNSTVIATATSDDLTQIRAVVGALDPGPTPAPLATPRLSTVLRVSQQSPRDIARAISRALPVRAAVSGSNIIVTGSSEVLEQAKTLAEQLDHPSPTMRYSAIYRMVNVDANSVADLLGRSFPSLAFSTDKKLNAIAVTASALEQSRIADAVAQLDAQPSQQGGSAGAPVSSYGSDYDVISLRAAVPAVGAGGSNSAADIAQTVLQAVGPAAPDLRITVQPNSTRLVLSGSQRSRELARELIAKLDVADPLVELDTRVLEVDEGSQSQLGLKFPTPVLGTTYSELTPAVTSDNLNPRILNLQPLTRTPLSLAAELDFLLATNKARLLEDPRITTFSGRTASLRAGETVNILTTTGGGTGTVATTQVQSFQTGVTLDITPVVNADDYITVTLHPSINSVAGVGSSGVPNIQNRDTTTTIGLHDGETLVIGGLIEDTESKTVEKIPLLGDIPLIGRLFQDIGVTHQRNELVVTVTPHILRGIDRGSTRRLSPAPSPDPLPTVESAATLPPVRHLSDVEQHALVPLQIGTLAVSLPSPVPSTLPTAFDQTNVFVYGTAPANNYVDPGQPPQIFYARASPTVVKNGSAITISAITTTNVSTLTVGPSAQLQQVILAPIGPGKWQTTFNLDASRLPSSSGNVSELLTATTAGGGSTTLRIPLSLNP